MTPDAPRRPAPTTNTCAAAASGIIQAKPPFARWRVELARVTSGAQGDPRVRVAMVDGPVDLSNPCFAGAPLQSLEAALPGAQAFHGTAVAGVLFAQPGSQVPGLVPRCRGLLVPVLHDHDGVLGGSQLDLARGIALALSHRASIINISAGQLDPTGEPHPYLTEMLLRAEDQGVLVVAATGNDGCPCLHVPAAARTVLAVGAADTQGRPLRMSNWGAAYRGHGVLAPGSDVAAGDGEAHDGTSWATAVVSGIAALLLSELVRRGETADALRVRDVILETADRCDAHTDGECERFLTGRLNITHAWTRIGEKRRMGMDENATFGQAEGVALPLPAMETEQHPPRVTASCGGESSRSGCTCAEKSGCSCAEKSRCSCAEKPACSCAESTKCSCGKKERATEGSCAARSGPPPLAYALGQLGYDFPSEARRDSLVQQGLVNPHDPVQLLRHLEANPSAATAATWTLLQDATPIYSIQPAGAFAAEGYSLLRRFLAQQTVEGVERISVPGWIGGKVPLSNGQVVPVLIPELRGMFSWTTDALVRAVLGTDADSDADVPDETRSDRADDLTSFLERIYFELRNLGILPQERAINYAATNAFQLGGIYTRAARDGLKLDSITAERSPICRPESDCWDVKLTFFNPARRLDQAREVHRITVDVSDVVPVTVGPVRRWHVY